MPSRKSDSGNDEDAYRDKRMRNNMAVKKSRQKSTQKVKQTKERVEELKKRNMELEAQLKIMKTQAEYLKDLILKREPDNKIGNVNIQELLGSDDDCD